LKIGSITAYIFTLAVKSESHLELLGLHLAVARKGVLPILGELLHPIAQLLLSLTRAW
jgi:hypothetical protein